MLAWVDQAKASNMGPFDRLKKADAAHEVQLGAASYESGRHQEALQHCDKALKIDPKNAMAWAVERSCACAF